MLYVRRKAWRVSNGLAGGWLVNDSVVVCLLKLGILGDGRKECYTESTARVKRMNKVDTLVVGFNQARL